MSSSLIFCAVLEYLVRGHGFLGDHVHPEFHGADDVLVVGPVRGGDYDVVGFGLPDHTVKVRVHGGLNADQPLGHFHAFAVGIEQAGNLHSVAEFLQQLAAPGAGGAVACTGDGHAHALLGGEGCGQRQSHELTTRQRTCAHNSSWMDHV